jgi:toxin YoeB
MRQIIFESNAYEQFSQWANKDKRTLNKILKLINETAKTPFSGTGKPEPLKSDLKGYWSRRIDSENRLIYKVTNDSIIIIACKYHYGV